MKKYDYSEITIPRCHYPLCNKLISTVTPSGTPKSPSRLVKQKYCDRLCSQNHVALKDSRKKKLKIDASNVFNYSLYGRM